MKKHLFSLIILAAVIAIFLCTLIYFQGKNESFGIEEPPCCEEASPTPSVSRAPQPTSTPAPSINGQEQEQSSPTQTNSQTTIVEQPAQEESPEQEPAEDSGISVEIPLPTLPVKSTLDSAQEILGL